MVWGTASDDTLEPLEAVINRAIKIMMFVPFGPADLKPIYRDLKLLDVKNVFKLETAKDMFKVKKRNSS